MLSLYQEEREGSVSDLMAERVPSVKQRIAGMRDVALSMGKQGLVRFGGRKGEDGVQRGEGKGKGTKRPTSCNKELLDASIGIADAEDSDTADALELEVVVPEVAKEELALVS